MSKVCMNEGVTQLTHYTNTTYLLVPLEATCTVHPGSAGENAAAELFAPCQKPLVIDHV